jgi:hypothetical protein
MKILELFYEREKKSSKLDSKMVIQNKDSENFIKT